MADKTATLLIKLKDTASRGVSKLRTAMQGLKTAAVGLGAGFVALGGFLFKSFQAWGVQREAVIKLDTALKNVEGTLPGASKRLQELASSLQATTTFGDETIIGMQGMLASFGMNEKAIAALTPKILDMATATGTDLNTAALAVGKTIATGTVGTLSRYGVVIDETALKTDALGAVVDQLSAQFDGQAEAVRTGPAGALAALKNTFGDLMETIGKIIEGPMKGFIIRLEQTINKLKDNEKALARISGVVIDVGNGIITFGTIVGRTFTFIGEMLANGAIRFASYVEFIKNLLTEGPTEALEIFVEQNRMANEEAALSWAELTASMSSEQNKQVEKTKLTGEQLDALEKKRQVKQATLKKAREKKEAEEKKKKAEEDAKLKKKEDEQIEKERLDKLNKRKAFDKKMQDAINKNYLDQRTFEQKFRDDLKVIRETATKDKVASTQSTLGTIATMTQSGNKTLFAIGKAAAIASALIDIPRGVVKALGSSPPPVNFVLAGLVGAAGAVQLAAIQAQSLAEGGIVSPSQGGTLVRVGEAGQSEAIVPLEDEDTGVGGTVVNLQVGTLVADDEGITKLAEMLDEKFFDMQRNNESITF